MRHLLAFFAKIKINLFNKQLDMTKKYGLLGHPLGHSFSRKFHNERFARLGIDAEYVNFDLEDISSLAEILANDDTLCGLNVTIPYKQQVMAFLDELDPVAARIGAVNTVVFSRSVPDGKTPKTPGLWLKGYNTDIIGFRDTILPLLKQAGLVDENGKALASEGTKAKALILGTGGASKAVKVALEDMEIEPVFVSRTKAPGKLTYDELNEAVMQTHRIIINCSPVGMFPHVDESPAIPYHLLSEGHVCYDLIYNPTETQFLARAKEMGAYTMSGGPMLEGQAIASYNYWTQAD